jgi:hypothetical protein
VSGVYYFPRLTSIIFPIESYTLTPRLYLFARFARLFLARCAPSFIAPRPAFQPLFQGYRQ